MSSQPIQHTSFYCDGNNMFENYCVTHDGQNSWTFSRHNPQLPARLLRRWRLRNDPLFIFPEMREEDLEPEEVIVPGPT